MNSIIPTLKQLVYCKDYSFKTNKILVLHKGKNRKMPIKGVKIKNSKNKKSVSFSCPKDHSSKKIGSVPCSPSTDTQTHTKVTTEGTLSGFQELFLQPIIKDRPNYAGSPKSSDDWKTIDSFREMWENGGLGDTLQSL